ncbi:MAG TPA: EamA family transporter [Candidatus Limnocylindrales bacterium]|nr:EamA family transporter [Candidatus Limnocylindrales bacterium]
MIGRRAALLSFLTSAVLAGGNGVGIRFSNRELPPLWGAGVRFGVAAALLLIVMAVMRLPLPRGRAWTGPLTYGLLNFAASYALGYYALLHMRAGFGQILLALVPLTTLLLAVLERQEKLSLAAVTGTLLAFAGVTLMAWVPQTEPVPLLAILAAVASTLCLGQTAVLVHRLPGAHPVTTNAIGMAIGAAVLLASSFLLRQAHPLPQRTETWLALVYLVIPGSIGVFVLYLLVLRSWPASKAAYLFVVIPFVTLALSAWLDQEKVGPGVVVGGLLVLAGVYFGALRRRPPTDSVLDAEGGVLPVERG